MTPRRWNRICDRWLVVVLIPLFVAAIHNEIGFWQGTLVVIITMACGGIAGAFVVGKIIEYHEDVLDWLKGY